MKKLQKIATGLDTFFRITYRLTIAVNVIGIAAIVLFLALSIGSPGLLDVYYGSIVQTLDFGGISFEVAEAFRADIGAGRNYFTAGLILGTLGLPVYVLMIRSIRSILLPMKEGLPFAEQSSAGFRQLGIWVLVNGGLVLLSQYFISGAVSRAYDLAELFLSDKISAVTSYYSFDLSFVILAVVLFGLSYVFRYGQELQKLSDETL